MAANMRTAMFLLIFTVTVGTINADRLDDLEKKFEERIKFMEVENTKQQRRHEHEIEELNMDKQQYEDLEARMKTVEAENTKFDDRIKVLEAENIEIKEQQERYKNENMRLKIEMEEVEAENSELDDRIKVLEAENTDIKKKQITNRQQQMEATITSQQEEMSTMSFEDVALKEKALENKELYTTAFTTPAYYTTTPAFTPPAFPTPAFHAYNNANLAAAPGYVIIFDAAIYNSGEYSTTTGVFICSVTGIYVFSFSVEAFGGYINAGLYTDTTRIAQVHIPLLSASSYNSGSGTAAVVRCGQFSEAMVKYIDGAGQVLGGKRSWFSGFLLHTTS